MLSATSDLRPRIPRLFTGGAVVESRGKSGLRGNSGVRFTSFDGSGLSLPIALNKILKGPKD